MKRFQSFLPAALIAVSVLVASSAIAQAKLDDATVFAIFDQANDTDIRTGRLGVKLGHSDEVRALGKMVIADHEAVQQMGRDLARKLGITPVPPANDTSAESLAKAVASLQSKSGAEFDRAYLRYEISYHQSVIDAIKGTLLPAVKNDEFKALITKVLPGFERHLAETKAAASKLGVR
jgi:putative membrane protein